jgi:hypothetical protein
MEALGIALGMMGDRSAVDTLRRARSLASASADIERIAAAEVWLHVVFALPSDVGGLRRAQAMADSILNSPWRENVGDPWIRASLAALIGRADLMVRFMRDPGSSERLDVPLTLQHAAAALLGYSAVGGPSDSLQALEKLVERLIEVGLSPEERWPAKMSILARAATLGFPDYVAASIDMLADSGDYVVDLQADLLEGHNERVKSVLQRIAGERENSNPESFMFDGLLPLAHIAAGVGDTVLAMTWLDRTLVALPYVDTQMLANPIRAAAMVRSVMLRADLAAGIGDRAGAAKWARAAAILWAGADDFLLSTVTARQYVAEGS